ncbi:MAG TPA: LptF/LptG family permease [Pirellulaceae bacterium]|jgi:lipopolysaccharide export system permease protein
MSSITRYITTELIGWLAVVLVGLTCVLVLMVVVLEASRMNLGLGPTLRLLPFSLPMAVAYAAPCAMLFTVCFVYGRMSADNEVIATKALGITPVVLLWPAWLMAFGLSLVGVWLTDLAFSWGAIGAQRVVIQSVEEITYGMLRTQKAYSNQRFSIIVKGVEDRKLIRPTMNFQASGDMPAIRITATEAELNSDLEQNVMELTLTDCEVEMEPNIHYFSPGCTTRKFPLNFFSAKELREGSPTNLPLRQITSEIPAQIRLIAEIERSLAAQSALALVTGDLQELSEANWKTKRKQLADARNRLFRLRAEPWRRWANGFSTLAFVLIGAPLAILLRRADVMTRFGMSFLPILLSYYPLLMSCCDRAKAGSLPPYIIWIPNVILCGIGAWLMTRVVRY